MGTRIDPGYQYDFDEDGNLITTSPVTASPPSFEEWYQSQLPGMNERLRRGIGTETLQPSIQDKPLTPAEWEMKRLAEGTPLLTNTGRGTPLSMFADEKTGELVGTDASGLESIQKGQIPVKKEAGKGKLEGKNVLADWNSFLELAKPEIERRAKEDSSNVLTDSINKGDTPTEALRKSREAFEKAKDKHEGEYKKLFEKQLTIETEANRNTRERKERTEDQIAYEERWNRQQDRREATAEEKAAKKEKENETKSAVSQVNDFYNKTHGTLSEILKQYQKETADPMLALTDEEKAVKSPERILKALKDLDVKRANDVTRVRRGEKPVDMESMSEWLQYLSSPEDVPGKFPGGKYVPKAQRGMETSAKTLNKDTARSFLKQAGGDKEKARKLAREQGYKF